MFQYNPANTGHTTGETGPTTNITEQWTHDTGKAVLSSPAVVDNTVYIGSWDNSVYALNAADGTEQWTYETGDDVFSSPAAIDDTVYIGNEDGTVYALTEA